MINVFDTDGHVPPEALFGSLVEHYDEQLAPYVPTPLSDEDSIFAIRDYAVGTTAKAAGECFYAAGFRFFRFLVKSPQSTQTLDLGEEKTVELFREVLEHSAQDTWERCKRRGWSIRKRDLV